MSNLVITSTTNAVTVDYGIYGGNSVNIYKSGVFSKRYLVKLQIYEDDSHIRMDFTDGSFSYITWDVAAVPPNNIIDGFSVSVVDSVDGVAPSSQANLYSLITALVS